MSHEYDDIDRAQAEYERQHAPGDSGDWQPFPLNMLPSVMERFSGELARSPYFTNYSHTPRCWRMAAGSIDGEPALLVLHEVDGAWTPRTAIALAVAEGRVHRIADYWHTPWVLDAAASVVLA